MHTKYDAICCAFDEEKNPMQSKNSLQIRFELGWDGMTTNLKCITKNSQTKMENVVDGHEKFSVTF